MHTDRLRAVSRLFIAAVLVVFVVSVWSPARADDWPQFRGPQRDNISRESGLLRTWPAGGPKVLWSTPVCEGYAAPAIVAGRVYFEDYGKAEKEYYVRCLNLADGQEIWRFKEAKKINSNHGITRATPATDGKIVFALDPKCVLHALDAANGKELWRKDFVDDYKAQIPPWYNGQNPLLDGDRLILGVGGAEALMVALDKTTGKEIWRTPNESKWLLSHASVMPAELAGVKQYLWCTLAGPFGVNAADGKLLWFHPRKFNTAVAPSPLPVPPDRVFMTSGYDAGTLYLRVKKEGDAFKTEPIFDWPVEIWNAEVHTPTLYQDHLYAIGKTQRGLLTCLNLNGDRLWTSEGKGFFGLGSLLVADGLLFVLEGDTGALRLLDPNPAEFRELARAQILKGDNVWAPMALSNGKLIVRDMSQMVCLQVGQ